MGKRAKKKGQPAAGSRGSSSTASSSAASGASPSIASPSPSERVEVGASCVHGANLGKLRSQLAKSSVVHCLACAKLKAGVSVGKDRKGKGKVVRKKSLPLGMLDGKQSSHKLWICLACGHVGCGGLDSNGGGEGSKQQESRQGEVGRGHAWQHWLQLKHPMVMVCGDEFSCWCFSCEAATRLVSGPAEAGDSAIGEGEGEAADPPSRHMLLQESAKLVREKLADQFADVKKEDSQVVNQDAEEASKADAPGDLPNGLEVKPSVQESKRVLKGLVNLGNTCFFNSVMQNLLSVEVLCNHFGLESNLCEGTLTSALRKVFCEAGARSQAQTTAPAETGKGGKGRGGWSSVDVAYNPKGLFGAICAKAPLFKGFQQQDSHELLTCLLDCLKIEEVNARKLSSELKTSGGKDALRALSKTGASENGTSPEDDDAEDSDGRLEDKNIASAEDTDEQNASAQVETFVDRVFGGQLSTTVACCQCGHSSVVYESFLNLSLPLPSRKPSKVSTLQNGNENAPSLAPSKGQKAQSFKNTKATGKTESELNVFSSAPAGVGTPPLLLLPPPPKDQNGDYVNGSTGLDDGWLDYMDPVTTPAETGWLDFLDDGGNADSGDILECSPKSSSQIVLGCAPSAPSIDSEIVFGCAPNLALMKQSSGVSLPQERNAIYHSGLGPVAEGCPFPAKSHQNGKMGGTDIFSVENESAANQDLHIPTCEKLLFLDVAPEATIEEKNCSRVCAAEKSGSGPIRCQEFDVPVRMRGGNESRSVWSPRDLGVTDCHLFEEQQTNPRTSIGESDDCNDNARLLSDIINGPNGTIILLGPPLDSVPAVTCSGLELEGEYDGVGLLFEEEDNTEMKDYGPFPLNHDEAEFGESSTYNEIVYDDVLDLSKISSDGRGDCLGSDEERQGRENEVSMSLQGCLQIFTKSELLSGDNAWECENCTATYNENFAALSDKPTVTLPQGYPMRRSISKDRIENRDWSCKKGRSVVQATRLSQMDAVKEDVTALERANNGSVTDPTAGELVSWSGCEDKDANSSSILSGKCSVLSEVAGSCLNLAAAEGVPSPLGQKGADGPNVCLLKGTKCGAHEYNKDDAGSQEKLSDGRTVDLRDELATVELGELNLEEDASTSADTMGERFSSYGDDSGLVNALISGNTSKPKKSTSRKVTGEPKKVIKQDAKMRILISRAPPVLTIHLKRFAQDTRGRLSKLNGHVAFREWLDLDHFLDHRHVNFACKYRLIGIVVHSGNLKRGHYVAFVRGPPSPGTTGLKNDGGSASGEASSWYDISDERVRETNLEAVLQSEAYLLFYERADTAGGGSS